MANVNAVCTTTNCRTVIDELALVNGGNHYLYKRWVAAFRAGTTTKCQNHYFDTDVPTVYKAYHAGDAHRGNRELA